MVIILPKEGSCSGEYSNFRGDIIENTPIIGDFLGADNSAYLFDNYLA